MPIVEIVRRAVFSASHRLHSHELSDEDNRRLFGKCNNPAGHGHNYTIEVTIRGEVDSKTGIVIDLTVVKNVIEECITKRLDHKNLNLDVAEFSRLNPTAENIAVVCWKWLQDALPPSTLHRIVVRETENNSAVYRGE